MCCSAWGKFCELQNCSGNKEKRFSSCDSVNVQAPGEKEERNRKTGQVELIPVGPFWRLVAGT